jgi:hypothetical protein
MNEDACTTTLIHFEAERSYIGLSLQDQGRLVDLFWARHEDYSYIF